MELEQQIEAVLFYKAEPVALETLMAFFDVTDEVLSGVLDVLQERLGSGGTSLTRTDTTVQLVTSPACATVIENLRNEEMKRDIGKAGAETLAIIAYRGPLTRAEIDAIRGVNSTFILRNLLMRGLIERRENKKDMRSFHYAATPSLFNHLGVSRREELPEFKEIMDALDTFEKEQSRIENAPATLT